MVDSSSSSEVGTLAGSAGWGGMEEVVPLLGIQGLKYFLVSRKPFL